MKGCVRVVQEGGCNSANLEGLDATSDEVGNHAHNGFLLRVLRQETWGGPSLFQVFYDGQLSRGNIEAGRGLGIEAGLGGRGEQTTFSRWYLVPPLPLHPPQLKHCTGLSETLSFPLPYTQ